MASFLVLVGLLLTSFQRVSAVKCCLTTCVHIEEERCKPILKQVEQKLGTPVQRVYVQEDAASPVPERTGQPTYNEDQVNHIVNSAMERIDGFRATITDILTKFEKFSGNLEASLTDATDLGSGLGDAIEATSLQAQLAHLNAEYSAVRASLGQRERFSCSRFEPATATPPEDECASSPCLNGGTCHSADDSFCCRCPPGFYGAQCAGVDNCLSDPCTNGGSCYNGVDGFTCVCPAGYGGAFCDQDVDDCVLVTCQNGGTCVDGFDSYTCSCVPGYNGTHCENNINDCVGVECQNGGTCVDGVNSYNCSCVLGFDGAHCENNIDDCLNATCQHGGTCNDGVNSYTCSCDLGYDGAHCENDINDCENVTCLNGGTCQDGVASYTCSCAGGYNGTHCENNIDDCANVTCHNGGTCRDGVNSYNCSCLPGYDGAHCENDIDDCEGVTCQNGGSCQDGVNSYTCSCVAGYNGAHCETNINECTGVTCQNDGTCHDGVNSYYCSCVLGFDGAHCENSMWTVFQRRVDGSVNFNRGWTEYVNGFGERDKEFWLGLEAIHQMTKNGAYKLRVELGDWYGNTAYATYDTFSLDDASTNYRINVGQYSGTAGDALQYSNGMSFTTEDADHDMNSLVNCAVSYGGPFWHKQCTYAALNGFYYVGGNAPFAKGVYWYYWKGYFYSLKFTELKFRKK